MNDYIKHDTENFADPQEEEDVPTSSGVVAARSKAKAKPQQRECTGATTIPLSERVWIDIEPSKQDLVNGINPAPHIHEHLRYTIMATAFRTPSRITTSCLSTLR